MYGRGAPAPSRSVARGGGIIAAASLIGALILYARDFSSGDWAIAACGAIAIAFVAMHALPIRGLRMKRTGVNAEAIVLDVAVIAPIFGLGGAVGISAAAVATAAGYAAALFLPSAPAPTDLARHGVTRVLVILAFLPFVDKLPSPHVVAAQFQTLAFILVVTAAELCFVFGVSAPICARTYHISIGRVWNRVVRDPRTWAVGAANVIWAAIALAPVAARHVPLVAALWFAPCAAALLLRTIDEQRSELQRLRLVRDAVQAMLGERDPLPQINAILATLRVPAFDETVTVMAAKGARTESWRSVTTLGPALTPAGDDLRRRILARLKFSGRTHTTLRDEYYIAYAFAARLGEGDLHGAMVVHRRHDRPLSSDQVGQFSNAAYELAPLLRDMRTITAAQNAAMIDGLTGLFNRATTMERLHAMLQELGISDRGSVLLLDIDHFKMINDRLGHAAGDECLRRIGEIIRKTVRAGDTAGRIGGEEFLVVMPGAPRDVALTVGERLRLAIALGGMRHASGEPVTTSIGAAAATVGDTPETLLARADRALYQAKRQGRNRIVEEQEESA